MGGAPGNILVPIAFLVFPLIVMRLFITLGPRKAIAIAFIFGWMFLPVANYDIFLLKNTKTAVICLSILGNAYHFDKEQLSKFQFNAADIPMLLWCTAPFFSSIANGLGPYDGLASSLAQSEKWGMSYYIARIYFSDEESIKMLAYIIFIGTLVYTPFCWYELIMSPQLHRLTYGFHQSSFLQTLRDGGGYRPMVYMEHGLMTAMWMVLGVFLGIWMLFTGLLPKKIMRIPSLYLLMLLIFTNIMMRSMGAISLFIIALLVVYISNKTKTNFLILILLIVPHLYIFTRTTGIWDGRNLSSAVSQQYSSERSGSLQFRFDNETILIQKALQGSFFGWGGYGRSRVYDEKGKDISITDGLWIITYGTNGIYGLVVMVITIQWPLFLLFLRVKPELWKTKTWGNSAVMAVFLGIFMIDNLLNAMINPVYMLCNGSLIGMLLKSSRLLDISAETITIQPKEEQIRTKHGTRFIPSMNMKQSRFIG